MDKYIGKRLEGRYDILELIGKGGMANVYRAYDSIDNRTVAVKILRDEYMNNTDFLRRFKNESRAIALLNHPNIVKVHDVSFSGLHYIVMEYIDGVTLKEYITHKGVLAWKDAIHFTTQILHALQHAHDKGIVHRDIKPQNIMLLRTGEIKVTDFGIARFARSDSRTISDRAIGSVHYISPEQAMGENTDERSDIYSVGIMLYEMLTGTLPFEADSAVSVAIKQVQAPIRKPRSINPDIPPGLEEITLRAVQKDSRQRYQSSAEMIVDLEKFRANPNIRFGYFGNTEPSQPERPQPQRPVPVPQPTPPNDMRSDDMYNDYPERRPAKQTKKKSYYLRTMFVMTLLAIFGSIAFIGIMVWMNNPFVQTGETQLPDFVGQKYEDIVPLYPQFKFEEAARDNNDEYNSGVVFEQTPRSGSRVKMGSTVKLSISEGKKTIKIADVLGEPAAKVLREMRDTGLTLVEERKNSDDIPAGRVISTEPSSGTTLTAGDTIIIYVSEGPENKHISVPDVTGLKIDKAKEILMEQGFIIGKITEESSDMPEETVIGQNPPAGSLHLQTLPINLTVSKGGMERFYISVPLPKNMNREVLVRARVGEGENTEVAFEEYLNPAQSPSGIWSPSFAGEEGNEIRILIYIDTRLYQEYRLDFETGDHWITRDRSDSSEFQQ